MKQYWRMLPWAAAVVSIIYLAASLIRPKWDGPMNVLEFGRLPVVYQGRTKPLDTLARNSLKIISSRQTFRDDRGRRQPAIKWLLDVIADPEAAYRHKVFRIDNDQVLSMIGLEPRRGFRYCLDEFASHKNLAAIQRQARRAQKAEHKDAFDVKVLQLAEHLHLFNRLQSAFRLPLVRNHEELMSELRQYKELSGSPLPLAVPPRSGRREWRSLLLASLQSAVSEDKDPSVQSLARMILAYNRREAATFNSELAAYRQRLEKQMPDVLARTDFEVIFNQFAPFYRCLVLYLIAFLLGCFGWLGWERMLNRCAFWVLMVALVAHTGALGARMYLQGRPPVTNLYSSAVFIGWGCVGLALVLEAMFRNGIGNTLAGFTGFCTLIIAHFLSLDGDTMEMLRAVLDTNFWLATHVTTITIGYSATFLAGFLGVVLLLRGVLTRSLDRESLRALGRMIYGTVCFAMLFSFVGTVLGGIWADQSWGRFWGWDPKENGALMIVLWNALILHAIWAGLIRERGLAALAICGNVVTAWSWFGVNMLGVGLHTYGFMAAAMFWLVLFVVSQLLLAGLGLVPLQRWASYASITRPAPADHPPRGPRTDGRKRRRRHRRPASVETAPSV